MSIDFVNLIRLALVSSNDCILYTTTDLFKIGKMTIWEFN